MDGADCMDGADLLIDELSGTGICSAKALELHRWTQLPASH